MEKRNATVTLPPELWREARALALLRGTTVSAVVEQALRAWVEAAEREGLREQIQVLAGTANRE